MGTYGLVNELDYITNLFLIIYNFPFSWSLLFLSPVGFQVSLLFSFFFTKVGAQTVGSNYSFIMNIFDIINLPLVPAFATSPKNTGTLSFHFHSNTFASSNLHGYILA